MNDKKSDKSMTFLMKDNLRLRTENAELKARWEKLKEFARKNIVIVKTDTFGVKGERAKLLSYGVLLKMQELESGGEVGQVSQEDGLDSLPSAPMISEDVRQTKDRTPKPEKVK